ncbi:lycopene epsilon cyclase, chloroplastic-like isoform X2 [Musa acuminata AAA Group]|uniref:Lycopene epsilon cyclase n=1 Tax=Musa acuminata subsp. malaccensis TaxID=214687 RepID=A0A804HQJ0_MUSAM|nr:PREDICTED: lycopene epsilon cyclase, chloroplastic isoform X2 [Musa acuminata subsp. malaccensis]
MECLGRANSAAISVHFDEWRFRRRKVAAYGKQLPPRQRRRSLARIRVRAAGGGVDSCVATGIEEFADEEDFVKAGGSERLFVRMQERKPMEKQSKIAEKLSPISSAASTLDLIVIGCGPAGLSLAAESAKKGLQVGLIGPDLPFTNNYGVWEDEFKDLGLESCIEHVWHDTIVYLDSNDPILIGRAYGRVSRHLLHEELLRRCQEYGVMYLDSKVEKIIEASNGCSMVVCEKDLMIPCRLATVASGAASGKLLEYDVGGPRVSVQTAYGVEVEEWSYIPVGGSLPNTEQKNLAFGAAASMVHPATGYSVVRSLSEAPTYASVIATILKKEIFPDQNSMISNINNPSMLAWRTLWPQERKRQRSFFLFGLALILQLDIEGIRTFFQAFFQLPNWMWQGFLGSSLSSVDLIWFAFYMFAVAPNSMRMSLVRHLLSDPTGATMLKTYLTL